MNDPIHIISLGAGVQSSTMALMAAKGEITPMPVAAIFADTQDEPASVYTWLDWLEKQLPFPVRRVSAGSLSKYSLKLRVRQDGQGLGSSGGVPAYVQNADGSKGALPRLCTRDFKVNVLTKEARRIGKVSHGQKELAVITWIGISLDEVYRMKVSPNPWQKLRYPLVDLRIRRGDCLQWMKKNGYPKPPRSACVYCPYHSNHEWRRLKEREPEAFERAVQFERDFQEVKRQTRKMGGVPYLHNSCTPLDKVDFSTDEDHGQTLLWGNECEGMCGV
jgi:hypothetical protein